MIKRYLYILIIIFLLLAIMAGAAACQKVYFMPGASYGYYIWEEDEKVHIFWSIDRKDSTFSGSIATDGIIKNFESADWEETDSAEVMDNKISYSSTLSAQDYSDGMIIEIEGHEYIELDLKINDGYDLSRVHLGAFLENPTDSPFRIEKDHFNNVSRMPWYERHPFSGLFQKLFYNKYFTFLFLFIFGAIIIEILRINIFLKKKRRYLYIGTAYIILICLEIAIYFILRFFVL